MREILFRGKRIDNGRWVYGLPVPTRTNCGNEEIEIVTRIEYETDLEYSTFVDSEKVNPETVGQFTGLCDKNGKKIFEGDIMPVWEKGEKFLYKVLYDGDCFMLGMLDSEQGSYPLSIKRQISEVIGNIHDNPELLENK